MEIRSVVVPHITKKKEVQLSSANLIRTCEVFMTRLAVRDCNLIVQVDVVILNILVVKVLKLPTF